ncbi:MAG: hypothetical protein OXK82_04645 [Deltaproteobacteria bacterium]|nr:hypothetical protein [Deltaproteobacteria bacterium]
MKTELAHDPLASAARVGGKGLDVFAPAVENTLIEIVRADLNQEVLEPA